MKQPLTTIPALNTHLSGLFAHAQLTSLGLPVPHIQTLEAEEAQLCSHVSDCCLSMVHFDLELPYCAGCGEYCQAIPFDGQA